MKDRLPYSSSPEFNNIKGLYHGFLGRMGGVSNAPYDFLNISFDTEDEKNNISENRRRILKEFSFDELVAVNQVHGTDFYIPGREADNSLKEISADIIMTDEPGRLLLIKTADCQPVLLADSKKRVCCGIHSGWKGSVSNVITKAIHAMKKEYDSDPENISAAIGPSLGPCCGEFVNYREEIPEEYWKFRVGEYHFDFWQISRYQLVTAGLMEENIWLDGRCTKCSPDFFSYRANKITGRQASVIGWR